MQLNKYLKLYLPNAPFLLAFMMQRSDYRPRPMINWLWKCVSLNQLMVRNKYNYSVNATIYLLSAYVIYTLIYILIIYLNCNGVYYASLIILVLLPLILVVLMSLLAYILRVTLISFINHTKLKKATVLFDQHQGIKIAVIGSFGKTTTKELLGEILSGGEKKVAISPSNKNTCLSHTLWVGGLNGDEDILIIEFGEEEIGDIKTLANLIKPTHAVITGIAPNHLEHFKDIDELRDELNSIFNFVNSKNVYVSKQYYDYKKDLPNGVATYSISGADGWIASGIQLYKDHTSFIASDKNHKLPISMDLLGEHNIPTVLLALAIGVRLGLSVDELGVGVKALKPFEHRMSHYKLGDVDIIDDTYNGNIEGFRAGLTLLKKLKAKRKIYVTPGLVDQGKENFAVHKEIGKLIIDTNPDIVVLMKNNNTKITLKFLEDNNFKGKVILEDNPLVFYQNLEHFTISGDLVLMQNDLPDEYA